MSLMHWGIDMSVAIAGGVGGVFRHLIQPRRPWWEAIISTTTGAMMAAYLAPAATPISYRWIEYWTSAEVDPPVLLAALAFTIGVMGRDVIERTIDFIRLYRRK